MTIRALVEPPEPESTTLHAVTFTNTDAGSGVVVVRLVPETLIPAEDATLQVLGLTPTRSREVGHTTTRSVGFPAWVISTHPTDTRQALQLVSDLEWARNTMPKVAKIEKKFATILADLGDSAPHFVPTLMEELARIFATCGKQAAAKRAFAKAREFERTYDLPVDSWRHRVAATEFAALGIIGAADMTREARAANNRCANPQEAYKYFLSLCINQIRAGGQVYTGMLRDIIRLGKAAGHSAADSGSAPTSRASPAAPPSKTVPWQFYKELAEHIRPAATRKPELYARLFAHSTTQIDRYGSDPGEWFTMISDLGVVDIIASDQRVFVAWLANIICLEPYTPRRGGGDLTPIIRGIRDKADLVRGQHIPANIAKIPLEILATLTTAGVTWDKKPDQQPVGESNQWRRVLQRLRHCHAGVLDLSACALMRSCSPPPWVISPSPTFPTTRSQLGGLRWHRAFRCPHPGCPGRTRPRQPPSHWANELSKTCGWDTVTNPQPHHPRRHHPPLRHQPGHHTGGQPPRRPAHRIHLAGTGKPLGGRRQAA